MPGFDLADRLAAAFRGVPGFTPYSFAFFDDRPSPLEASGSSPHGAGTTRCFRYDRDGASSWVEVHGGPRTAWHRRVVGALERAGYARTFRFPDSTVCQRWLRTRRECLVELRFLARLAEDGPPPLRRAQRRRPSVAPRSPTVLEALEAARAEPIPWDHCGIVFSCRERLRGQAGGVSLVVGTLGIEDEDGQRFENFAGVRDASGRDGEIPAGLRRAVRRELRAAGYRVGKGSGGLSGAREVSTIKAAVSECKRMLARMQGVGVGAG